MCGYVLSNAPPCPEMADRDSDIMVDVLMSWVALDVVGRWLHRISWSRPPRSRCREERAGAVGVVVSEKWSLNRFVALHVRSGYHPQTDHGPAGDSA